MGQETGRRSGAQFHRGLPIATDGGRDGRGRGPAAPVGATGWAGRRRRDNPRVGRFDEAGWWGSSDRRVRRRRRRATDSRSESQVATRNVASAAAGSAPETAGRRCGEGVVGRFSVWWIALGRGVGGRGVLIRRDNGLADGDAGGPD